MKTTYHGSCHCGVRSFSQSGDQLAMRVNCLDDADPQELIDAPVKYFDMRHDNLKTPPAETRHL